MARRKAAAPPPPEPREIQEGAHPNLRETTDLERRVELKAQARNPAFRDGPRNIECRTCGNGGTCAIPTFWAGRPCITLGCPGVISIPQAFVAKALGAKWAPSDAPAPGAA